MSSRFVLSLLLAATAASPVFAESRTWKSADGVRTLQGEFIKRDASSVTIRNSLGKEVTIELTKLHADDQKWLDTNHSLHKPIPPAQPAQPASNSSAVFDTLTFDDTRETALAKLKASKIVEMTVDETFIGRSGLNGVFRTRQKMGTLTSTLSFDWTEDGKLKEITLQTESRPDKAYKTELESCWKQFIELLDTLYGTPVQKGPIPSMAALADGSFFPSHLWNLKDGGSVMLGTAREGLKYQVVVRFSKTAPKLLELP